MTPQISGALAMMACALLWSLAGLFIQLIDWSPLWIGGLRSLIAAAFLSLVLRRWKLDWNLPMVVGAVANSVCMLLFVLANKETTPANAILIQYWAPVATAILGLIVLKERLRWEQVLALMATAVGLVLLFSDHLGPGALWGNLAAFGSGLAFSLVFLMGRLQKQGDPVQSLLLSHVLAAAVALPLAAWGGPLTVTPSSLMAIGVLGVAQVGLAALFFGYAIKRIPAVTANLLAVIEPVFNPIWVFLVMGTIPAPLTLAGGALIVISVTAASVISARRVSPGTGHDRRSDHP